MRESGGELHTGEEDRDGFVRCGVEGDESDDGGRGGREGDRQEKAEQHQGQGKSVEGDRDPFSHQTSQHRLAPRTHGGLDSILFWIFFISSLFLGLGIVFCSLHFGFRNSEVSLGNACSRR